MITHNRIGWALGLGLVLTLGVACDDGTGVGTSETICDDGADNDGDGLVDCDDPDCAGNVVCDGVPESLCADNIDNDDDGAVDCADDDCTASPDCIPPEADCANGLDDDGDLLVDCNDSDCLANPDCEGQIETDCANGLDDDGDLLIDCNDPNCTEDASCLGQIEILCDDQVDNDSDGLTDCDDPNCIQDPACAVIPPETLCEDGVDNDGDGLTDCDDSDCDQDPACIVATTETDCANQTDDDGDGLTDCDDPDCVLAPACEGVVETLCNDQTDNDSDGATDCDDSDCANYPTCGGGGLTCGQVVVCMQSCSDMQCMYQDCINAGCPSAQAVANPLATCVVQSCGNTCQAGLSDPTCMSCIESMCADEMTECAADTCATPTTEIDCGNQVDDDGDGAVDCDDTDCTNDPSCNGTAYTCSEVLTCAQTCGDLTCIQDCQALGCASAQTLSQDLLSCMFSSCAQQCMNDPSSTLCTDCMAANCGAQSAACFADDCSGGGTEICDNQQDDDGDGAVDCADPDCAGDLACPGTANCGDTLTCLRNCGGDQTCMDGCMAGACDTATVLVEDFLTCRATVIGAGGTCETDCANPMSQMCNGCVALACDAELTACQADTCGVVGPAEICDNGQDDDGDGFTDCSDTDCVGDAACANFTCGEVLLCNEDCSANQTCTGNCTAAGCTDAQTAWGTLLQCWQTSCQQCFSNPTSNQCRNCTTNNCSTQATDCDSNTCP